MEFTTVEKKYIGCPPGHEYPIGIQTYIVDPKADSSSLPPIYNEIYDDLYTLSYAKPTYTKFYEVSFVILTVSGGRVLFNVEITDELKPSLVAKMVREQADDVPDEIKAGARVSTQPTLRKLAESDSDVIRALVAINPKTSSGILKQLSTGDSKPVAINLVQNPNSGAVTIKNVLTKFPDLIPIYLNVVENMPVTVAELIYALEYPKETSDSKIDILSRLCRNSQLSNSIVTKLLFDIDIPSEEKMGLITREDVPMEAIEIFVTHISSVYKCKDILLNIAKRSDCTEKVLDLIIDKFLSNFVLDYIPELLKHKNVPSETLKKAAMIHNEDVVHAIVTHPNVTKEVIDVVLSGGEHALLMYVKNIAPDNVLEWIDNNE